MKKRKIIAIGLLSALLFTFGYIKYYNMNINDIGLKVLGWVKKLKGQTVDISSVEKDHSPVLDHALWTELLQKYVTPSGKVSYKGFINDSANLNAYLDQLSETPPGKNWNEADKMAYWINVYNAFTVKLIVDHYPLKSIKDIANGLPMINSPWDIKFFKIGDTPFDLNTVEHDILRKQFDEPRIHFAINCASISCPKLKTEAFSAQKLESQLEAQAIEFINNPSKNIISKNETQISMIFDWFRSDFTKVVDLHAYIKQYNSSINPEIKVEFMEYDWGLNE